jgi:prephenate dehydratase
MTIAIAGSQGSFSHQAAELYITGEGLTDVTLDYALDSAGVFAALKAGTADLGLMPIYNNTGGLVKMTLDAMGQHTFTVKAAFDMSVQQCLLILPNVRPDVAMKIYSHPQALAQCQNYLDLTWPECLLEEYSDTAQAAADLEAGKLPTESMVLASKLSAELYHLRVVAEGIQDNKDNKTVFVVLHLAPSPFPDQERGGKPAGEAGRGVV